jgi:hydroxylaminobenzene mutase
MNPGQVVNSVTGLRHPLDPDPVRSTKAPAVFALGLVAALTGLFIGGVVPATVALVLAKQARREAYASAGYLTGARWLARGEQLARFGIGLAVATLVVVLVLGILGLAQPPTERDFAPGFN